MSRLIFILGVFYAIIASLNANGQASSETLFSEQTLFKIERSKDADEVIYALNLNKDGSVNSNNPIKVNWLKKTKNNRLEPLTWIQKNYSYGIEYLKIEDNRTAFVLKAYPKRIMVLTRGRIGYHVLARSGNYSFELNKIYIQFNGGTFWMPNISKVEIHGKHAEAEIAYLEIIKP